MSIEQNVSPVASDATLIKSKDDGNLDSNLKNNANKKIDLFYSPSKKEKMKKVILTQKKNSKNDCVFTFNPNELKKEKKKVRFVDEDMNVQLAEIVEVESYKQLNKMFDDNINIILNSRIVELVNNSYFLGLVHLYYLPLICYQ